MHGELIVRAPLGLSEKQIFKFVKAKEQWITAQKKRVLQTQFLYKSVLTYHSFLYLGKEVLPIVCSKAKKITLTGDNIIIPSKWASLGEEKVLKKIENWFRDEAKIIIMERVIYVGAKLNLSPTEFSTNNSKVKWGSCSRSSKIAINWRAVMLPPQILDYIVIHEFCHILEFSHSKHFWGLVATILPNWKELRLQLKNLNWLLDLFR